LFEEAIGLMRRGGQHAVRGEPLFARGLADIGRGRLERIPETVDELEAAARASGDKAALGLAHHLRGRVAAAKGDIAAARRHLAEASRLLADNGNLDKAGEVDLAWAAAEHASGDAAAAVRILDGARARLAGAGDDARHPFGFFAATLRARIDAEAGRITEARRGLAGLGDAADSPSVPRRLAFLVARAALARAEHREGDARKDLAAARRTAQAANLQLDPREVRLAPPVASVTSRSRT
jgi:hypothetical protein